MRALALPSSVLAVVLAGCTGVQPVATTTAAVAVAAAPAPTPGYDWHFTPDDTTARLAYGVAESDDLRLGLDCTAGSGKIELVAPGPAGARQIYLESGGETERYVAVGEPSELHDGDLLTARGSTTDPVFQRFRRVGWIAQWVDGARELYVSHPGSEAEVERFFQVCG